MLCPNCDKEVPKGKKFCGYCGQPLAPVAPLDFDDEAKTRLEETPHPPQPGPEKPASGAEQIEPASAAVPVAIRLCPFCGAANPVQARFCNVCGANLVERQVLPSHLQTSPPSLPAAGTPRQARSGYVYAFLVFLGWAMGGSIALGTGVFSTLAWFDFFHVGTKGFGPGILFGGIVGGVFGSLLIGLYFHWLEPGFGWGRVLIVSGCLIACGLFCGLLAFFGESGAIFTIFLGLPVSVILSSAVLFWLLWRSHQGL